jgi:hypothetical protein
MTAVDSPNHLDREVERRCDICGEKFRHPCYPRTDENQRAARKETQMQLRTHLFFGHSFAELKDYVGRLHQV